MADFLLLFSILLAWFVLFFLNSDCSKRKNINKYTKKAKINRKEIDIEKVIKINIFNSQWFSYTFLLFTIILIHDKFKYCKKRIKHAEPDKK